MIKDVAVNFVLFSKVTMLLISVARNEHLKWSIEELPTLYLGFCL